MRETFILIGRAACSDRGVEAVIRSTVDIICRYYDDPAFIVCGRYTSEEEYSRQVRYERDRRVRHIRLHRLPEPRNRFLNRLLRLAARRCPRLRRAFKYHRLIPIISCASAVLYLADLDDDPRAAEDLTDALRFAHSHRKKLILWSTSLNRDRHRLNGDTHFTKDEGRWTMDDLNRDRHHLNRDRHRLNGDTRFTRDEGRGTTYDLNRDRHHLNSSGNPNNFLKDIDGIFCRESRTLTRLKHLGIEKNAYLVCDPSYALMPAEPVDSPLFGQLNGAIGFNASPASAEEIAGDDYDRWLAICIQIVNSIASLGHPILLVPQSASSGNNDYHFLEAIKQRLPYADLRLVSLEHTPEEIKWLISKLSLFCSGNLGVACLAMSAYVPTINMLACYAAQGIHHDIFGHTGYCLNNEDFSPLAVMLAVTNALRDREHIVETLEHKIGDMIWDSYKSGKLLKSITTISRKDDVPGLPSSPSIYLLRRIFPKAPK